MTTSRSNECPPADSARTERSMHPQSASEIGSIVAAGRSWQDILPRLAILALAVLWIYSPVCKRSTISVNPVTAANPWNEESVPRFDTHSPPVPPLSPLRHSHSSAEEASHRARAKIPSQLFRLGNSSAAGKSARARSSSLPFHPVA